MANDEHQVSARAEAVGAPDGDTSRANPAIPDLASPNPAGEDISTINVDLEKLDRNGEKVPVPISLIVNVFSNIQEIICSAGDWLLQGGPPRRGNFKKVIKESCELELTGFKLESVHAELKFSNRQRVLFGETKGEQSLALVNRFIAVIKDEKVEGKDIYTFMKDAKRVRKILGHFYKLAPGVNSRYKLDWTVGKQPVFKLTSDTKVRIKYLNQKILEPYNTVEYGHIRKISFSKVKSFELLTSGGSLTVHYGDECLNHVRNLGNSIARVSGIASLTQRGVLRMKIESPDELARVKEIPFIDFSYNNQNISFAEPIMLTLEEEDEVIYLSNQDYNLLAESEDYKECIDIIKSELATMWEWFVDCPEEELSKSGLVFREKLLSSTVEVR